jgi:hypothetical protein
MNFNNGYAKYGIISLIFLFVSCAHYEITRNLEKPIPKSASCIVGPITDDLPEMNVEKKPTLEEVAKLKKHLYNELNEHKCIDYMVSDNDSTEYEVTGGITEFTRGSGAMRFLFGFGLGSAKLKMNIQLVNKNNDEIIFGGRFWGEVSDWMTPGDQIYKQIAHNFAKALQKESKKAAKQAEMEGA